MMVRRFVINYDSRGEQEHPHGDFVHWPDYQALSAKVEELERQLALMHDDRGRWYASSFDASKRAEAAEVREARLREALRETCEGFDGPEERCPRHPDDCACWRIRQALEPSHERP